MSFDLPNLDVMQAQKVLDQLVRRIPGYAPGWTDHNPSDPGITLLQMLVWICEGTAYTANAIPLETYRNMLRWIAGLSSALSLPDARNYASDFPYAQYADTESQDPPYESLKETLAQMEMGARLGYSALQEAVVTYRRTPYLAITPSDLTQLTTQLSAFLDAKAHEAAGTLHVARVCLRQRGDVTDLFLVNDGAFTYSAPTDDGNGTFSIALSPPMGDTQAAKEAALLDNVRQYFAARTLLGGAISISNARLVPLDVRCQVRCFARERADEVASAVLTALESALQPIRTDGGRDWAYGATVDAAALMTLIAAVPGVDRVESLTVQSPPRPGPISRLPRPSDADQVGPTHGPHPPQVIETGLPRLHFASVTPLEADDD
jgi:hypothetical protein